MRLEASIAQQRQDEVLARRLQELEEAPSPTQERYWSNLWHTLIIKDTSGFTSNTFIDKVSNKVISLYSLYSLQNALNELGEGWLKQMI